MYNKKIVIIGGGVAGMCAATKLIDGGYPGELITVIDKGMDPYKRPPEEVMLGAFGAGLFSDGKISYLHGQVGGLLSKYCGEEKADELVGEVMNYIRRFHPDPSKIMYSAPLEEPEFIKPYFNLRLAPTYHIGTNFLHDMGKKWFDYLVEKKINFIWETEINDISFEDKIIFLMGHGSRYIYYDKLIYCTGKSGIDLTQMLINKHSLEFEKKAVQIGVRMEVPQKYFQNLVDIAYDFKLYQKPNEEVSLRTFCTNNFCAYVAEEVTYSMKSFNGHSFKEDKYKNNMTNFGIIMELKGIDNPFEWAKNVVNKCQQNGKGLYYSPNKHRHPSLTSEGNKLNVIELDNLDLFKEAYGEYSKYILQFIEDLNKIFKFGDDYGLFIPEVKFLSEEVLVNYNNLSLKQYPDVFFAGDSLSARGIAVSGAQGIYCSEGILEL